MGLAGLETAIFSHWHLKPCRREKPFHSVHNLRSLRGRHTIKQALHQVVHSQSNMSSLHPMTSWRCYRDYQFAHHSQYPYWISQLRNPPLNLCLYKNAMLRDHLQSWPSPLPSVACHFFRTKGVQTLRAEALPKSRNCRWGGVDTTCNSLYQELYDIRWLLIEKIRLTNIRWLRVLSLLTCGWGFLHQKYHMLTMILYDFGISNGEGIASLYLIQ